MRAADVERAFKIAGLTPGAAEWSRFLNALLLWMGVALAAAGVIFFFAYNWAGLPRFGKFGIAEGLLAAAVIAGWRLGVDRASGQAAVLGASLLTGALLALVGQTYQTGADTFELFAYWAALILPWVVAARFGALWLVWIILMNLAAALYFQARAWGLLGVLFGTGGALWTLLGMNAIFLTAWEAGIALGVKWLERWGARVVGTLVGVTVTTMGVMVVLDSHDIAGWAMLAYLAWVAATYGYYRWRVFDVFMLSGWILSGIVVVTTLLVNSMIRHMDAGGFLFIGLVVIALSGAGGWWIHGVVGEQAAGGKAE